MLLDRFRQSPSERKVYTVVYSDWLEAGETIVGVSVTVSPTDTEIPFNVTAGINPDANTIIVTAGGGLGGYTYVVTLLVETTLGQFKEDCLEFIVEEVCAA